MTNRRNTVISNVNVVHKAVLGYKLLGSPLEKKNPRTYEAHWWNSQVIGKSDGSQGEGGEEVR